MKKYILPNLLGILISSFILISFRIKSSDNFSNKYHKSQGNRNESLSDFKAGQLRVLVATDLLARGIDIEFLPYVINYELPRSPKDFVHRIGRTGRAENPGEAISFVTPEDEHHFRVIKSKMKKRVPMIDGESLDLSGF